MNLATGEAASVVAHYLGEPWYKLVILMLARDGDTILFMCKYERYGIPCFHTSFPMSIVSGKNQLNKMIGEAIIKGDEEFMKEKVQLYETEEINKAKE